LPSPVYAAALSAVFPGLGHLRTRPSRAKWLIWSSLAVITPTVGWLLTRDRRDILAWTVKPTWLLVVITLSLITLVARAVVAVDAAREAGLGRTRHRWATRLGLVAVVVVVALPHLAGALLAWQQRQLVTRVFIAESTITARPTDVAATGPASPAGVAGSDDPVDAGAGLALDANSKPMISSRAIPRLTSEEVELTGTPAGPAVLSDPDDEPALDAVATLPTPSTRPEPSLPEGPMTWNGDDQLSIVMLGSDGGYDRKGIRTDTIIVLSIDVATGDAVTFSVPRNWEQVPFPGGTPAAAAYPQGNPDLANTVYGLGLRRPDLFPGSVYPGGAAIKEAMAQTLGIPIHYFVMVDMTAVVETIDLFGGIDLVVTEYINDRIRPIEEGGPALDITVQPGEYHFDGLTALAYVRSRVQSWDYSRMARQRCVVGALIDQVGPLEVLTRFGPFTDIVADHVVTDIPIDRADELLAIAGRMDPDHMQSVNFVPPRFPSGRVPLTKVRDAVTDALSTDITTDPTRSLTAACGP
jgi:LCP family protein required for cell wall assembly